MLELLYLLQERLRISAVASVTLLKQDFKLGKAIEQFAAIASASPVLAKIYKSAKDLQEQDSDHKGQELLDLLALINAVILTQTGTTTGNELEIPQVLPSTYKNISNKTLQVFHESIYSTGGGRLSVLEEILSDPTIYGDYRILHGMIAGLEDGYSGIVELIEKKLVLVGEELIPSLKKDIRLDKDRVIATKIDIILKIAKEEDDIFYKDLYLEYPKSTIVRGACLNAISTTVENISYFKELFATMRVESLRTICLHKIIEISDKSGENYVNEYTKDILKGSKSMTYSAMVYSTDPIISEYIIDEIEKQIELFPKKKFALLQTEKQKREYRQNDYIKARLLFLSANKPCARWYEFMLSLLREDKTLFTSNLYNNESILDIVLEYVLIYKDGVNKEFMEEVVNILGKDSVIIDFIYDLWNKPAEELFTIYEPYFSEKYKTIKRGLLFVIKNLEYNREKNEHSTMPVYYNCWAVNTDIKEDLRKCLKESLDPRWYALIVQHGTSKKNGNGIREDITTITTGDTTYNPFTLCQYTFSVNTITYDFQNVLAIMNPNHTAEVQSLMDCFMKHRRAYWIGRWEEHENHVFWVQVQDEILRREEEIRTQKKEAKKP